MPTEVIEVVVPGPITVIEVEGDPSAGAIKVVEVIVPGPQGPGPSAENGFVAGDGIASIIKLTQAEYDALTADETTLYVIVG